MSGLCYKFVPSLKHVMQCYLSIFFCVIHSGEIAIAVKVILKGSAKMLETYH